MPSDDGGGNKRLAIVGVASLFLVAAVIGVTVEIQNADKTSKEGNLAASRKAIDNICMPTDYKETCKRTLQKAAPGMDDPNELVKAAFNVALQEMTRVSERSTLLRQLQKDPKTAKAVKNCKELFNDASDDFRRSVDQVGTFDLNNIDKILSNLKVWLSATVTYQETCLDGFQNNTAEDGEKVRKLLNTSMQLSSNGIAIVTGMSDAVGDLQLNGLSSGSRRLLSSSKQNRQLLTWSDDFVAGHNEFVDDEFIEKMSRQTEKKGKSMILKVGPDDMIPRWLDLDDRRRKLLQAKTLNDLKPNVVVAQDGTGKYKKIGDAFTEIPRNGKEPFVIFVKEGVYKEHLRLEKWQTNVVLVGAGPTKTRLTGNLNFIDGVPTFQTCTLAVCGDHFIAKDIGIENTAGPEKHQAVALRVQSDQSIFYNCHFDGYQDTLYTHTYRQYYRGCQISGTIDFIFGDAAAFFQNCTFVVRKPLDNQACIVTAQGRKERHQPTGIIIHKSKIVADPEYFPVRFKNKAYLGRPWKEFSKTLVMESDIDDLIQPDGWMPWEGEFGLKTCYYGEYRNEGPGANMEHRVKWPGIKTIKPSRAEKFMPPILYEGDDWIKASGVPYIPALVSDPSDFALLPGSHGHDEDPNQLVESKDKKSKESSSKSKSKDKSKESSDDSSKESKSKSSKNSSSKSSKDSSSKDSSSKSSDDSSSSGSSSKSSQEISSGSESVAPSTSEDQSMSDAPTSNPSLLSPPTEGSGVRSESPSSDLERTLIQKEPTSPSPSSMYKQEEPPTVTPSESPSPAMQAEPPTSTPRGSPSLLSKIKKMLMQTTRDTGSPVLFYNLEKKLMQVNERKLDDDNDNDDFVDKDDSDSPPKPDDNDNDNDDDINDHHDKLVTSTEATVDKFLETLHLKKRSDLSLDQIMEEAESEDGAPSPSPSSSMLSNYHLTNNAKSPFSSPSPRMHKAAGAFNEMVKGSPSPSPGMHKAAGAFNEMVKGSPSPSPGMHKAAGVFNEMVKGLHLGSRLESSSVSPSPAPAMAPVKDLERELLDHVSQKEGEKPDLAKLAASPQSKNLPASLNGKNASELAKAPGANDLLSQFGLSASSLQGMAPGTPSKAEGDGKKESSGVVCEVRFLYTAMALAVVLVV